MPQASDLGYLLHKHPDRLQSFTSTAGTAYVFYPEASPQRCTAALMLEVDPVSLVRGKERGDAGRRQGNDGGFSLRQYVNDRPYAASSLLAVALGSVFRTALAGRCTARPELVNTDIPLEIGVPALPCRGGPDLAMELFQPLGWEVTTEPVPLDPSFPDWGDAPYVALRLTGAMRLATALSHLYVLLPVLDGAKHYAVGEDEVDKLLRAASGWLPAHPRIGWITRRYLAHRYQLVASALARLADIDDALPEDLDNAVPEEEPATELVAERAVEVETAVETEPVAEAEPLVAERGPSLAAQRITAVLEVLRESGARRVLDLGCGEGALTRALLDEPAITEILATDVSARALAIARRKLRLDRMPERRRARLRLEQGSLSYRDPRLAGWDAAVLMEVVEHVDPSRLPAVEAAVFGTARPGVVLVTTPNVEYNPRYEFLTPGAPRHQDHRFEWTRAEFRAWAAQICHRHGYGVRHLGVGDDDPEVGPPTQLAVFTLGGAA